jgi:hypothetical protein
MLSDEEIEKALTITSEARSIQEEELPFSQTGEITAMLLTLTRHVAKLETELDLLKAR